MNVQVRTVPPAQVEEGRDAFIRSQLAVFGLRWLRDVSWNEAAWRLVQKSVARGECRLSATGAVVVETGTHTGRSPKDKFIVKDATTEPILAWGTNNAMDASTFALLKQDMLEHARLRDVFVQDLEACPGADESFAVRVITETGWAALFMRHLLAPTAEQDNFSPELTLLCLPSFKATPARHGVASQTVIALDLAHGVVLIAGTAYAGEMKKAVFTVLNYLLPEKEILPMHCAANVGQDGSTALFFGLSGTGKTTLSTDIERQLIGDDEHAWGAKGVFNIENGCYAKAIGLDPKLEPAIYKAAVQFGTVLENVAMDGFSGEIDFGDCSKTENTRAAYPLSQIDGSAPGMVIPHPKVIVMLTADAFGVLPPVALLSHAQAIEQFLLGYTAKLAGTERGITEPVATFSSCFGAPFLPRPAQAYAELLRDKIAAAGTRCYLLNTGWTGGGFGKGSRIRLQDTRAILKSILNGTIDSQQTRVDTNFGFHIPLQLDGIDSRLLDPRQSWDCGEAYDAAARKLSRQFASIATEVAKADP